MAESKKFEFTVHEVEWLRKALQTQRNVLVRLRSKETVGSEIHALRGNEVAAVDSLINKI